MNAVDTNVTDLMSDLMILNFIYFRIKRFENIVCVSHVELYLVLTTDVCICKESMVSEQI